LIEKRLVITPNRLSPDDRGEQRVKLSLLSALRFSLVFVRGIPFWVSKWSERFIIEANALINRYVNAPIYSGTGRSCLPAAASTAIDRRKSYHINFLDIDH